MFSNVGQSVKEKGLSSTSSNTYKTANTLNSFNTFKSSEDTTIGSKLEKKGSQSSKHSYINAENDFQLK